MFERRRRIRRAVCGGVVLGSSAALVLGLLEIGYLALASGASFPGPGFAVRFDLYALSVLVLAGALIGLLQGALGGLVVVASGQLSRRRASAGEWAARLYTGLATPGIALVCALAFQGRRAKTLPHKDLIAVGLGIFGIALFYLAARMCVRAKDKLGRGLYGRALTLGLPLALAFLASVAYVADQRVLPRLYGFFHVALAVLAFLLAQLAIGGIYLALRSVRSGWRRVAEPWFALAVLLGSTATGLYALGALGRAEVLRPIAFERAALLGKTLRMASALHAMPTRPQRALASQVPVDQPAVTLPAGPRLPGADLFLITIDALRADHVGAYGYQRPTTPHIDAEARRGVLFERAYAQVPHTSFSIATLLTGKYVYSLAALGDSARHETLPEVLRNYRYKTAGFYPPSVFYIDEKKFLTYQESHFGFEYVKFEYLDADKRVDQIIQFLETEKPARTFVWVHLFEPHEPYEPHPGFGFGASAVDRYDGEIAFVDAAVGHLLAYVHRARPGAVVAISADHGEEFGEHGGRYHGTTLYDEQIRVPLILSGPGIVPHRVAAPVETVDLTTTLLSLVDIAPSARMRGTDLGPWLSDPPAGDSLAPPAFAQIETKKMVAAGSHKLICDTALDSCELFDLAQDPGEQRSRLHSDPQLFATLRGQLDQWIATHSRLEVETAFRGQTQAARRALERGRLGDAQAVPELAKLLASSDPGVRREAARLLARLPEDERARSALAQTLGDREAGPWAAAALARSCHPAARKLLRSLADGDPELEARAGIALAHCRDPAHAFLAAGLGTEDVALRKQVILALGASCDEEAVPLLLGRLDAVLERAEVVQALGLCGSRRAVPALLTRLTDDRFVHVRAAAARALGDIDGRAAAPALMRALGQEKDAQVAGVMVDVLYRKGALSGVTRGPQGRVQAPHGELWVGVDEGATGALELRAPASAHARVELRPGVPAYRFAIPRGASLIDVAGPAAWLYGR